MKSNLRMEMDCRLLPSLSAPSNCSLFVVRWTMGELFPAAIFTASQEQGLQVRPRVTKRKEKGVGRRKLAGCLHS